ncbi:hypothetical protein PPERSA_00321 [Pseudocohnilembus persalinus]|uniref:Metallo-beta-lactamase domain-containing protein n=1 Tax=Pseudocohnilembus persalinus TaxID=266149 RepID=A0A0V0QHG0_PSEPJ|nr:hypothetical protein PPERSA_00321 [Pseudocohnilembus persalinus]|eukprot:KRX01614.1 hypothetical protein PPERSA_00321 [Pseudocohnilembus persalinus]
MNAQQHIMNDIKEQCIDKQNCKMRYLTQKDLYNHYVQKNSFFAKQLDKVLIIEKNNLTYKGERFTYYSEFNKIFDNYNKQTEPCDKFSEFLRDNYSLNGLLLNEEQENILKYYLDLEQVLKQLQNKNEIYVIKKEDKIMIRDQNFYKLIIPRSEQMGDIFRFKQQQVKPLTTEFQASILEAPNQNTKQVQKQINVMQIMKSVANNIKIVEEEEENKSQQQKENKNGKIQKDLLNKEYIKKHQLVEDFEQFRFLLIDEKTKSLISIDPGESKVALYNIEKLEAERDVKLTHILQTHNHGKHNDSCQIIKHYKKDVEVICGNYGEVHNYHTKTVQELVPFSVGELAICFLHTPGHTSDSCTIAVTHVSETSTKLPFLFTGDLLLAGSIGSVHDEDFSAVQKSLFKLQAFPNETFIFPSHDANLKDLLFAKTLDPKNEVLNIKIEACKEAQEKNTYLLPTSLIEEKNYNPYLRLHEKKFQDLLEEKDQVKAIKKLKLVYKNFF